MNRTLAKFLKIKKANSLTDEQVRIFKLPDTNKGWHKRYAEVELSEYDWALAINSLKGSRGKFNNLNYRKSGKQYLYLMKMGSSYKIGISKSPVRRRSGMQTGCPEKIELVAYWSCVAETIGIELHLHEEFSDYRLQGEWFDLGEEGYAKIHQALADYPNFGCKRIFYNGSK